MSVLNSILTCEDFDARSCYTYRAADDLATQGARLSSAVVLTQFSWNIQASAPGGLIKLYVHMLELAAYSRNYSWQQYSQVGRSQTQCKVFLPGPWWLRHKLLTAQLTQVSTLCPLVYCSKEVNPLWPSDAIWQRRSGSTLAQVMACCLTAPSHYLNQCWLIISEVQRQSTEGNFTKLPQPSITKVSLKFTCVKFHSNLRGANELTQVHLNCHWISVAV